MIPNNMAAVLPMRSRLFVVFGFQRSRSLLLKIEVAVRFENPAGTGTATWLGDFLLGARLLIRGKPQAKIDPAAGAAKGGLVPRAPGSSPKSIVRPVPPQVLVLLLGNFQGRAPRAEVRERFTRNLHTESGYLVSRINCSASVERSKQNPYDVCADRLSQTQPEDADAGKRG